jgi:hypothetical protein
MELHTDFDMPIEARLRLAILVSERRQKYRRLFGAALALTFVMGATVLWL